MNPEKTIGSMISTFLNLFPNKQECVHHLLFILGNGLSWSDGGLVGHPEVYKEVNDEIQAINHYFSRRTN